jgi:predicted O-methyltransferase YrrM
MSIAGGFAAVGKSVLPRATRRWLRQAYQRVELDRAMRRFIADPSAALRPHSDLLRRLIDGWANPGWSAKEEYLRHCIAHALQTRGAILECGSGLSTLLIAAVAKQRELPYWALEHSSEWSDRVRQHLVRHELHAAVHVWVGGLREYSGFAWYDPPLRSMPEHFSLVICDGPPADTRGGRYGLVPVMRSKLAAGSVILVDDAIRERDRAVALQWQSELDAGYEWLDGPNPSIRLVVAGRG